MATRETTLDLPTMCRAASIVPGTVNEEARTVEVVWTTGARVMRGFFDRYWEELSLDPKHVRMGRINNGAPLLNAHDDSDTDSVIGVVESARLEKTKGTAKVRFARAEDDPEADKIFRKVKDGILQNVSVGYQTYTMEKIEDSLDGIPVFRATDWEPYEISVVPMGADDGAGFRAAAQRSKCTFITREKAMADEAPPTTAPVNAPSESAAVALTREAVKTTREERQRIADAEANAAMEATKAERERVAGLRRLAKKHRQPDSWVNAMVEKGVSVDDAGKAVLEILAADDDEYDIDGTVRISAGDDARDKFIRGASAWLFQRTGTRQLVETAKAKHPELFRGVEFDPGEFRGYAPIELARLCLERQGVKTRGMDRMALVGAAFTHRAANYQTTGDFPTLLENVVGKVSLGAYLTQPNTWSRIAKVDEVPDFRASGRYRTGAFPGLDVIAEHQEYKNGAIPDGAKYPISTQRMGKIFALTREVIINDDLSELTDMAAQLGGAAQRSIENSVYALINANSGLGPTQSDGQPFFHANRNNVGTGSALSVSGLDADAVTLGNQKDPNAQDFIDLQPAVLLVPRALRGLALQLNDAQFDPSVSNKFQLPNMVRGMFREIVSSPRLTSATRRYMVADPLDWIVVAFLEGYGRGPVFESKDGWRIDGVEWKVTLYAKAQMGDPKAALTNAGA